MKLSKLQLQTLLIIISCSLFSCKKEKLSIAKPEKQPEYLLESHYDSPFFEKTTFQIKHDSSYVFTKESDLDHDNSSIILKGKVQISNDTIFFINHRFVYNQAKKAVLKNNLIIFLNAENPYRLIIKRSKLAVNNYYDLSKFSNYSTFNSNESLLKYYYEKPYNDYELNNNDMIQLDRILKKMLKENNDKLKPFEEYVFQCCAIKNDKDDIEVFTNLYCNDEIRNPSFKTGFISMNDGGNCNVSLKINLTKNTYSDLMIAASI